METKKKQETFQTFVAPPETSEDEYLLGSDDEDVIENKNDFGSDDEYDSDNEIPLARLAATQFWKTVTDHLPRSLPAFHEPIIFPEDAWEPIDYFHNFFDTALLNQITGQSNLYALQSNPSKPLRLTVSELEQIIAIKVYMSIFYLHRTRNYWSENF